MNQEKDYEMTMEELEKIKKIIETDKFYRMPEGLSREEKRDYILSLAEKK